MNTNNTAIQQPVCVMFTPCVTPSIAYVIEPALHFARLAEIAAIAGAGQESVQFTLSHVSSMLDDVFFEDVAEDHRVELSAAIEYAGNAAEAANNAPDDCYGAIKLLVSALIDLQERVARYDRYDMLGRQAMESNPAAARYEMMRNDGGAV